MLRVRGGGWGPVYVSLSHRRTAGWGPSKGVCVMGGRGYRRRGRAGKVSGNFLLLRFCLAHWWAGVAMIKLGKRRWGREAEANIQTVNFSLFIIRKWRNIGDIEDISFIHLSTPVDNLSNLANIFQFMLSALLSREFYYMTNYFRMQHYTQQI